MSLFSYWTDAPEEANKVENVLIENHEEEIKNMKSQFKAVGKVFQTTIDTQKNQLDKQNREIEDLKNELKETKLRSSLARKSAKNTSSASSKEEINQRDKTILNLQHVIGDLQEIIEKRKGYKGSKLVGMDIMESFVALHQEKLLKVEKEHTDKCAEMRKKFVKEQNAMKESVKVGIIKLIAEMKEKQDEAVEMVRLQTERVNKLEQPPSRKQSRHSNPSEDHLAIKESLKKTIRDKDDHFNEELNALKQRLSPLSRLD
jgi:vacuolar-type H+-ATPase subunit I/STV1